MRNYYFTSVWVSVSRSGADSVLCSLFGVLYFRLEIIFLFRVLGFRFCLYAFFFSRVLHVYFRVLSVCFVLRALRKTFSFLHCMILFCILWFWFLCFRFGICVSVLGLVFLFGFCGMYFPFRPPYIWPPFLCMSIHYRKLNLVKNFLTIQIGKRLNYLRI